jgi:ABC-type transporter Mla subunit MlaD
MFLSDLQLAKTTGTVIPEIPGTINTSITNIEREIAALALQYEQQRANNDRSREIQELIAEINRRVTTADQLIVRVNSASNALQPLIRATITQIADQANALSRALSQASTQLQSVRTQLITLRTNLTAELSNLERAMR